MVSQHKVIEVTRGDDRRYSRQRLFSKIGVEGQKKIVKSSVTLIGCGGLGSTIANSLVRAGVGRIKIVDRDYVEKENLLHQILYNEDDARMHMPKAKAAQRYLQKINSDVEIEAVVADVHYRNIEEMIGGSDVVMDGTDNFEARYLMNDACLKRNIPWIYGTAAGSRGMTATIVPGLTPCLRCIFPLVPPPEGIRTCDTEGVIVSVVQMVASLQVVEGLKLLTGEKKPSGGLTYCDAWEGTYTRSSLSRLEDCPSCQRGEYPALKARKGSSVNALCGRNTVMITYYEPKHINLSSLAKKLEPIGQIDVAEEMLLCHIDGYEMAVFPDGRAIIKGTEDPKVARGLYSRYVGN